MGDFSATLTMLAVDDDPLSLDLVRDALGSLGLRILTAGTGEAARVLLASERPQIVLLDLDRQTPVPLPGLNRGDAQPISVSVDSTGERLALVRQREGRTELVLYRRSLMSLQPIPMEPAAVPHRVQLRADGRQLAVEVSRDGLWQIDLVELP